MAHKFIGDKFSNRFKRIKSVKLPEYFRYQRNEMVTYRITPHISVSNTGNARMWRSLAQIYAIYDRLPSRLTRNGFHVTHREKDAIWYDVLFRRKDGDKSIEFYVTTSEIWAEKLRDVIENYMKVTLSEVDAIDPTPANATLSEVKLNRHDIFSLHTDNREQTTPVSSILTACDDLTEDGDMARLSIACETMNRKEWAKRALYAHEKLAKQKVPQRGGLSAGKVVNGTSNVIMYGFESIFDVLNNALDAITNVFFEKDENKARDETKAELYRFKSDMINEIESTRTSSKTNQKQNAPVWKTRVRIATSTNDKLRSDLIGNTIGSAFGELSGDNEMITVNVRGKRKQKRIIDEINTHHLSRETKADANVSLLSSEELAKVSLQMPTASVQERYESEITNNQKIVTEIPKVFTDNRGLLIGHSEHKGVELPIYLPSYKPNEFYRGYVFPGEMGMGKDTAIQNFVVEGAINHGISFVVVDQVNKEGAEGMANGIRDSLPADKIVDLDFSNEEYLPSLDLTEVVTKLGRRGADRFANELIDFFGDVEDKAQSKRILRTVAKASGGSLRRTKDLMESEALRRQRVAELLDENQPLLALELEEWTVPNPLELEAAVVSGDVEKADKIESQLEAKREKVQAKLEAKGTAIINRLDDFFGDSTLNYVFSQPPNPAMDFEQFMREGKTVIIRVPDRILGTVTVRTLVHWITLKTLMTRLLMDGDAQANGSFIVYNEPQTYLNDGLSKLVARIATQGRKERLGALIAVQYFDQLGKLTEDLTGGGVNWILFRNGSDKLYAKLKARLEPHVTIDEAMRTESYHALNLMTFGNKPQNPFLVRMLPPCYERYQAYDNAFLTRRHAQIYGRKWAEIERDIMRSQFGA